MHLVTSKTTGAVYVIYEGNERALKNPRGSLITTRFHASNRIDYAKRVGLKKL